MTPSDSSLAASSSAALRARALRQTALPVPVAPLREHGHHVVLGEHVVVVAHERHCVEVQVHRVNRHDLRAAHVGLGPLLRDVGRHRSVGHRHPQREHRLDAAPALGLGELPAVVVLGVEDGRDARVVPAVHHVGVGHLEPERAHGGGAPVPGDQLVGLAVGHHDERGDLAVHLDAARQPRDVAQLPAVLVPALDARRERDLRRFHLHDLLGFCGRPFWAGLVARALGGVRRGAQGGNAKPARAGVFGGCGWRIAARKVFAALAPRAVPARACGASRPPGAARPRRYGNDSAPDRSVRRCHANGNAGYRGDAGGGRMRRARTERRWIIPTSRTT